jgi:hypothetical protein
MHGRAVQGQARGPWIEWCAVAGSALLPGWVAAAHVANIPDAAHDEAVVRSVGFGWTGAWRALDAVVSAGASWLPLGTRSCRAGLASSLVCAAAGVLLYVLARRLLVRCAPEAPRLGPLVAAIASTSGTLSGAWQLESSSPGSSVLGALLAVLPLAVLSVDGDGSPPRARLVTAFLLGLAFSYEPWVGIAALVSSCAWLALSGRGSRIAFWPSLLAFAVGLLPLLLAILRKGLGRGLSTGAALFAASAGEHGVRTPTSWMGIVHAEVGWVAAGLSLVGVVLALASPKARALAIALAALAVAGFVAAALGAPIGPSRFGGPVLASLGVLAVLAGVAMQAVVRAVAEARVPFAAASAAMIVVLELTFPVLALDDGLQRRGWLDAEASRLWEDIAWGSLPPGSLLLVERRTLVPRILASLATGELRGDLAFVALFDIMTPAASRELVADPRLAPLWRDLLLGSAPEESSLSSIASERPLVLPFEPHWERPLARHFVPVGLIARFEPEPRGTSDRTRALDAFAQDRDSLRLGIAAAHDAELAALTAALLYERALSFAETGERELAVRALDDRRLFLPDDLAAASLASRLTPGRSSVDVHDLVDAALP